MRKCKRSFCFVSASDRFGFELQHININRVQTYNSVQTTKKKPVMKSEPEYNALEVNGQKKKQRIKKKNPA